MRRIRILGLVTTAASTLVVTGVAAFACTNLATLNLSSTSGSPGDQVTVTGSSFRVPRDGTSPSPVAIHWNSATENALVTDVIPDQSGAFTATVTVPDATPGNYVIVATQLRPTADGSGGAHDPVSHEFGTPARAGFVVEGASAPATPAPGTGSSSLLLSSESGVSGMAALMVSLGVVGLGLFVAAFGMLVRSGGLSRSGARRPARASGPGD